MNRVIRHATMQARVRARLGELPGPELWRELSEAPRLDALLDRLRASALAHWVSELPRRPDPLTIERHMAARWRARQRETARLLPASCRGLRRRLDGGEAPPGLTGTVESAPDTGAGATGGDSAAGALLAADAGKTTTRSEPHQRGVPAAMARRLERAWRTHAGAIAARRAAPPDPGADPDEQWLLRAQLERRLHDLAAGDPFHPALALMLIGLEWIQFERVRALLLARGYGWPVPRFFPG